MLSWVMQNVQDEYENEIKMRNYVVRIVCIFYLCYRDESLDIVPKVLGFIFCIYGSG